MPVSTVEPQLTQVIGDYLRRAHFAVGKFRVLVEVAPPGNDFRINGIERGIDFGGPRNREQCAPRVLPTAAPAGQICR